MPANDLTIRLAKVQRRSHQYPEHPAFLFETHDKYALVPTGSPTTKAFPSLRSITTPGRASPTLACLTTYGPMNFITASKTSRRLAITARTPHGNTRWNPPWTTAPPRGAKQSASRIPRLPTAAPLPPNYLGRPPKPRTGQRAPAPEPVLDHTIRHPARYAERGTDIAADF